MSKARRLTIWKRIAMVFIAVFVVLISTAYIVLNYWEPIISASIKDSFYKSTNKLYRINFEDISFNVFLGNFSLRNIQLIPDHKVYQELKLNKEQPAYLFELSIDRAIVQGINLYALFQENKLEISDISVNKPEVKVINDLSYKKGNEDTSMFRNPYDLIKNQVHNLSVKQINLKHINFEFIADSIGKRKSKKIYLAYFKVRNLLIDSLAQYDTTRPFYSDDIKVSIKNFTHPFKDSVNSMIFEEAVASTATSSIQVYNFKIVPKLSEEEFKDSLGFRKTRIELYVKEANLQNINFKKLFFEQKLYGGVIDINKLETEMFSNNDIPKNPNKKVRFPSEFVHDIRIPFYFKQVNLNNSKLAYAELHSKTKYRWQIDFSDMNGTIENLSNDTVMFRKNQFVTIKLLSNFNKKAKSNFEFVLDYLSPLKPFYLKGFISNYNLQDVNPIVSKLAHLEVSNCNLRIIRFVFNGDKKRLSSNITMLYNNLRVKVLQYDEEENKLKRNGFLTLLANHMVLEGQNPRTDGKLIKSKFELKRANDQSFFGLIWKGLLKGIKESVGLDERVERELKFQANRYYDFKSFTKELKENRKDKKDERKQKRLQRRIEREKLKLSLANDSTKNKTIAN